MLVGKLGALVRKGKTFTLGSHLKGPSSSLKASNEQYSLLRSLRSSPRGNSPISRYSSLYGFKFMSKNLNVPSTRKMTTSEAMLHSAKAEAANSGIKLLVVGPHHAQKWVGIWLFCCASWVFWMIQFSRGSCLACLTLSMTDRKFTGERLQLTGDEWNHEFEKYMQSPGYKCVKSLSDFKLIHLEAYAHRMMGRGLGIVFGLPFAYFLAKGYITRPLGLRLSLLFALGGAQGLFGCLTIVKNGTEEPASEYVQARVSPYRHAMHITSAYILYGGILWTALSVFVPEPLTWSLEWVRSAAKFRQCVLPVCALVGVTAISGAFVAGNGAGRVFNTFPKMGDTWIPDDIFNMESFFHKFFEDTSTVQLNHKILGTTALLSIASLCWTAHKIEVHPAVKFLTTATLAMASIQVILGIGCASGHVSVHQAGALALMSYLIILVHSIRKPSPQVLKSLTSLPSIKS